MILYYVDVPNRDNDDDMLAQCRWFAHVAEARRYFGEVVLEMKIEDNDFACDTVTLYKVRLPTSRVDLAYQLNRDCDGCREIIESYEGETTFHITG